MEQTTNAVVQRMRADDETIAGWWAQEKYRALFPAGHKPKIDTRTPADIKRQRDNGDFK